MKIFLILFLIICSITKSRAQSLNLNKTHKNLFQHPITEFHQIISKKTKLEIEEVAAIEASFKTQSEQELLDLISNYKKLPKVLPKELTILKNSIIPVEIMLNKFLAVNEISKLELLKIYKLYTNLSLKIDDNFFHSRNLSLIKEFETYDIFLNSNITLNKINQFAFENDQVLAKKLSMRKIDNEISFFDVNFSKIEDAKKDISKMLNKSYSKNTFSNLIDLKIETKFDNFGVIYFVSRNNLVEGAMVLDKLNGRIIEIILI